MKHEERLTWVEQQTEKNTAAIRDLILVSRTSLDAISGLREAHEAHEAHLEAHLKEHERISADIDKLREAQAATDEKLNILIDTVDRIIRNRNSQN